MGRNVGDKGKDTETNRALAKWFCEKVSDGWIAATGKSEVNSEEIARGLGHGTTGRKYIDWSKGARGLKFVDFEGVADAAVEKGWLNQDDLRGSTYQPQLAAAKSSELEKIRKAGQEEIREFNTARSSLIRGLESFRIAWGRLKHHTPKDAEGIHLDSLNADADAGRLSVSQVHELQTFNEHLASPRHDLLRDVSSLQMELGRLRLVLMEPPQASAQSRPAISSILSKRKQDSTHEISPYDPSTNVVWDDLVHDEEGIVRPSAAFDNLVKLSRDRSFKLLRSSLEAVTKLAHSRRYLK